MRTITKKIISITFILTTILILYVGINYKFRIGVETKTFLYFNFSEKGDLFANTRKLNFEQKIYVGNTYGVPDIDFYVGGE